MFLEKLTLLLEEKGYLRDRETGKLKPGTLDDALSKYFDSIINQVKTDKGDNSISELESTETDPVDTITMDVPLFIRILEYSREDAQTDMDLHDLAEKAIAATKQQGILSMDDYDMLVGELEKGGIDEKIREIAETIKLGQSLNEEKLCKRGREYIAARKRAGEKSSAYLSGRAVRVCKGDIKFKGKKQKDFKG